MDVSRVSHDFQGCFQSVSRKFQENVFQKSFMLHGTHRSFPSTRRYGFLMMEGGEGHVPEVYIPQMVQVYFPSTIPGVQVFFPDFPHGPIDNSHLRL